MPFKDTIGGQTHSYNDGCGEPAHNDMKPEQELLDCLAYCLEVNGREDCKNCSLDSAMIKRVKLAIVKEAFEKVNRKLCGDDEECDCEHYCHNIKFYQQEYLKTL